MLGSASVVYLFVMLDSINNLMEPLLFFAPAGVAAWYVSVYYAKVDSCDNPKDLLEDIFSGAKRSAKVWAGLLVLVLLIPDFKDMKMIIGGTLVLESAQGVANLEGVKELPQNLVNAANLFLEQVNVDKQD